MFLRGDIVRVHGLLFWNPDFGWGISACLLHFFSFCARDSGTIRFCCSLVWCSGTLFHAILSRNSTWIIGPDLCSSIFSILFEPFPPICWVCHLYGWGIVPWSFDLCQVERLFLPCGCQGRSMRPVPSQPNWQRRTQWHPTIWFCNPPLWLISSTVIFPFFRRSTGRGCSISKWQPFWIYRWGWSQRQLWCMCQICTGPPIKFCYFLRRRLHCRRIWSMKWACLRLLTTGRVWGIFLLLTELIWLCSTSGGGVWLYDFVCSMLWRRCRLSFADQRTCKFKPTWFSNLSAPI